MIDFMYRDELLSSHNCIIAYTVTSVPQSISAGSEMTQNTVINNSSHKIHALNTTYETPISATFDVVKYDCSGGNLAFTDEELLYFSRWLQSKTDEIFKPIYENEDFEGIYYYGRFTAMDYIYIGGNVIGLTLTFTANAPFGFYRQRRRLQVEEGVKFAISNESDEIGKLYPDHVKITCQTDGILSLQHVESKFLDDRVFIVRNCSEGEIITLDCVNKIIETSNRSHTTLYNDFNYNWICLVNEWKNTKNEFLCSMPCFIEIEYELVRKVGIVV